MTLSVVAPIKGDNAMSRSWSDRHLRYQAHAATVDSKDTTEWSYIRKSWSLGTKNIGGEGVMWIQAVKPTGYWLLSILAFRGRAFCFYPMTFYLMYCLLVVILVMNLGYGWYYDPTKNKWWNGLSSANGLVGIALFFIQNSRVGTCYSRWLAAADHWMKIQSSMAKIIMLINAGTLGSRRLAKTKIRWLIAFLTMVKRDMRNEDSLHELKGLINKKERTELEGRSNGERVMYCWEMLQKVSIEAKKANVVYGNGNDMGSALGAIFDSYASAMVIMNIPMAFALITHVRTFLVLWLAVLPWIFMPNLGYFTIVVATLLGYALMGLEATALELESPMGRDFNDLPIDNWADPMIEFAFKSYVKAENLPVIPNDEEDRPSPQKGRYVGKAVAEDDDEDEEDFVIPAVPATAAYMQMAPAATGAALIPGGNAEAGGRAGAPVAARVNLEVAKEEAAAGAGAEN